MLWMVNMYLFRLKMKFNNGNIMLALEVFTGYMVVGVIAGVAIFCDNSTAAEAAAVTSPSLRHAGVIYILL